MINSVARGLRLLPPEAAHFATVGLTRFFAPLLPPAPADDARLAVALFGRIFPNPIGLAAGFDKNVQLSDAMLKLGFGFVECGTVTPQAQAGNPRPRLFRLAEDRAVINRLGFNNAGMDRAARLLARRTHRGIVGINVGANRNSSDRVADYVKAYARLSPLADYATINVSSPNTPGLRGLQNRDELRRLLSQLNAEREQIARSIPMLLKIAPDLDASAMDDIAAEALDAAIDGLIVSNTTISRPAGLHSAYARETGGLSGKPLFEISTRVLREMRLRLGTDLVLIGVGGVASGADAYVKIRAGANLVQLYTALAYEGPGLVTRIKQELNACLARDGFSRVKDAVGADIHG